MKVEDVEDVKKLIMYSSRTISDMKRAIDYNDLIEWNLQVIIREFQTFPLEYELRGFVYKGSLNALTQYYADCYFKIIEDNNESIKERVKIFFDEIKDSIPIESYIIDFIVLEDKIMVIELNPFAKETGPGLFDWIKDKEIIENGPFEFRYVKEIKENDSRAHLMPWKHLLEGAMNELEEENKNEKKRRLFDSITICLYQNFITYIIFTHTTGIM